ncbi:MAG: glycosyl hydrolase family 65 protein [Eubacteriales bacterium]|nr:glycosyl hydrolase family 65 protein [Eubacteriales bacterium]
MNSTKQPIYPIEEWKITETEFCVAYNYRNETTFSLSNGYLGTRGTFEEGYFFDLDTGLEGNFVNGFYESEKIRYGEANFGSPLYSQSLLNLPNLKTIRLFIEGEEFSLLEGETVSYERTLHMKAGILTRNLIWRSPRGKKIKLCIKRLVSFAMQHIMAISYEITPLNFSGEVRLYSQLQANVENHTRKTNPIVDYGPFGRKLEPEKLTVEGDFIYYRGITQNSKLTMACACTHVLYASAFSGGYSVKAEQNELDASLTYVLRGEQGKSITLQKFICYATDLDMPREELDGFVRSEVRAAQEKGFVWLSDKQKEYMGSFWERADIEITGEGNAAIVQGIRFNLFHILQSSGRNGYTGMGAKGLSGEGYEGHYFWDTEMYILPVFVYTEPEVARKLLEYRYRTLDKARSRARILGHDKGALFPWRTINGEEASTYFPLGTAQYHINADISYAVALYLQVSGDLEFFKEMGAEILIETARVWADVGCFAECKGGKYCICSVTGPDEYNVLVDNNFYTNLMARENLRDAAAAVRYLQENAPVCYRVLKEKLSLEEEELTQWDSIVENMYFPYDEEKQIYPMDDGFMMRKPWDESRIPPEKRAWLYENYHPLFIMRHRMSKQADAILGFYLHNDKFTEEEIKRNYDFYQTVTLHHSSLSTCIFGIVACDIGYTKEAYRYFEQAARMDLDDYHNNFYAGIHAANMAGTWQAIVNGFAGLRCHRGKLYLKPYLPEKWQSYRFKLEYRGNLFQIEVTAEGTRAALLRGTGLDLTVYGKRGAISWEKRELFVPAKRQSEGELDETV